MLVQVLCIIHMSDGQLVLAKTMLVRDTYPVATAS